MSGIMFIDNGVTGSIGIIKSSTESVFLLTPTVKMQDYTKAKKNITRVDVPKLMQIVMENRPAIVILERPMINPTRFAATISAVRCLEATLSVLETLEVPYKFVDSKEWQRGLLPSSGKKGTDSATLKQESHDIGIRLFPMHKELIHKHKDADGILGAFAFSIRFPF